MAGIAGFFGSTQSVLDELGNGLAARGPDTATWHEGRVGLAVRAALPMIHSCDGLRAVVEGVTEISRLLTGYVADGATALVRGGEPYAIAVADPDRDALVLARSGDGPALYYAVLDATGSVAAGGVNPTYPAFTVLAAAEPGALIAAGVAAVPDAEVIGEFVDTGRCDETEATFFAGIRRVLPGQVVEITRRGVQVTAVPAGVPAPSLSLPLAVQEAVRHGRLGVRLGGAADDRGLLAAVLAHPLAGRPVPAYQPVLADVAGHLDPGQTDLDSSGTQPPELAPGSVRRELVPVRADLVGQELPSFLADLGEPVPDVASYLLWCCARASMGDTDTLLDPGGGTPGGHRPRVADRIAAHLGVGVRFPLGDAGTSRAEATLTAELLDRIKDRVYGAFLTAEFASRPWVDASEALGRFDRFAGGEAAADPGWFWRLYLVEQWLRRVVDVVPGSAPVPPRERFAPHPGKKLAIGVDGQRWVRFPVRTDVFGPGDSVPKKVAGYVTELVAEARAHPRLRDVFGKPWYVVTAEKVVAVAQSRSYLLWEIRPGRWARMLARLASPRAYGAGSRSAWIMELAVREVGRMRMLFATLAALLGRPFRRGEAWFERVAGARVAAIDGPADHSMYPANLSATLGAANPDEVAAQIAEALRRALPADAAGNLRGCAVLDARDSACRVRGLHGDRPEEFWIAAFADNPLGQGGERTPVAVVVDAAAVRRKRTKARPKPRRAPAPTR